MWSSIKAWLVEQLQAFLDWFMELLDWAPKQIFSALMDGLAAFLEALPVPDFIGGAGHLFGGIPSAVSYITTLLAVNEGIAITQASPALAKVTR